MGSYSTLCTQSVFVILVGSFTVEAFFPNNINRCHSKASEVDHTHSSITELAISHVINEFSSMNLIPSGNWKESQRKALADILEGSNEVGRLKDEKAAYHFNAERFTEGNELLISRKNQILELFNQSQSQHSLKLIRHLIGQSLHLIQDFYSNSDWVQWKEQINKDLGMENRPSLEVIDSPCRDVNPNDRPYTGLKHRPGPFASGYRAEQDIEKPSDWKLNEDGGVVGKCGHGGLYDSAAKTMEPRGGINSESFNFKLSPRKEYHSESAKLAGAATEAFFFNRSDYGLSSLLSTEQLLSILGVGGQQHVSLLQTSSLHKMSGSMEWLSSWASYSTAWPWDISHLYTSDGDIVSEDPIIYEELRDRSNNLSLEVTQTNILQASEALPDGSRLMVVTNSAEDTLDQQWNGEVIKKILIERSIQLWWFVQASTPAEEEALEVMEKTCLATGGMMFYIKDSHDLLDILSSVKPDMHLTHYTVSDQVNILLAEGEATFLVTNCDRPQTKWPMVSSDSGEIFISEVVYTDYISVRMMQPHGTKSQVATAVLEDSHMRSCTVSVWAQRPLVRVYPTTQGSRAQWYPTAGQVCDGCKVAVEVSAPFAGKLRPQGLLIDKEDVVLQGCRHDTSREELRRTSVSEALTGSQLQADSIQVKLEYDRKISLAVMEYITTRHVDIVAQTMLLDTTGAIDIVIINTPNSDVHLQFTMTDNRVNISLTQYLLSADANCSVRLMFPPGLLQKNYTKSMSLIVKGIDQRSGEEFSDVHTFRIIALKREKAASNVPSTTVTTNFNISTSNIADFLNISTAESRIGNNSYDNTITPIVNEGIVTSYFSIGLVGTILCLTILMMLAALVIFVYNHHCKSRRPYYSDHKPIPVTEL